LCAFQAAQAVDSQTFVLTGPWATPGDFQGNGIQLSTDGGNTWSLNNWNQGTVPARYSAFISATTGYVSGGSWPGTSSVAELPKRMRLANNRFRINRFFTHDGFTARYDPEPLQDDLGYTAIIAKTTNGGKSFQTVVNMTGQGIYFNEITCTDVNTCWVVGEGSDTSNAAVAWIYGTTDGFQTIQKLYTFPSGSLITISMVNSTYGWAGGAAMPSSDEPTEKMDGQAFLTTNGGKTWTPSNQLKNFYFTQISAVDGNNAYGAGITPIGLSSLARYQ